MEDHIEASEQIRLQQIQEVIEKKIKRFEKIEEYHEDEVMQIRREFWDEVSVNVSNDTELAETAASISQQQTVLDEQERSFQQAVENIKKLRKLKESPYFAQVDFTEAQRDETQTQEIYIGLGSLVDEETHDLLVYDWRAPISSLFYDFTLGAAHYDTPIGVIEGEITLKRQFIIKQGQLESMFDTGIQIGDHILQTMLGKNAHEKMTHIVTTIQQEQNEIIRDEQHDVLVVQGAAGSGKTSVAMQRVAYLLYRFRNTLNSENMVLFSPNAIFNDYVSNVLPELGEVSMQQTTFQEHLEHVISDTFKLEDSYDQLEYLLTAESTESSYKTRVKGIAWKTSRSFMYLLDTYEQQLTQDGMLFHPFVLRDHVLISNEELEQLFYQDLSSESSVSSRIKEIHDWILEELKAYERQFQKELHRKFIAHPRYLGTESEMKEECTKRTAEIFAPLKLQWEKQKYLDLRRMYQSFFEMSFIPSVYAEVSTETVLQIENANMWFEDATSFVYFSQLVKGMDSVDQMKHVLIDEAQDYSPFQLEYIRKIFPRAKLTILGDFNQEIFHANQQSYQQLEHLFEETDVGVYRMTKSYRSTVEIVTFTHQILQEPEPIEPIGRHGELPQVTKVRFEELDTQVAQAIHQLKVKGADSVAVICKTAQETNQAYETLRTQFSEPIHLITKDSVYFQSGITVIPTYLAKGLEFDGVIIYNASASVYSRDEERKLLYTACTRALHYLQLFYVDKCSSLIPEQK